MDKLTATQIEILKSHPAVLRCIERVDRRHDQGDSDEQTVYLRLPWNAQQEPGLFVSDEPLQDCIAIYSPADDGWLI